MFDEPSRNIIYTSPLPPKPTPSPPGGLKNRQVIARSKASAKIAKTAHARVAMKTLQERVGFSLQQRLPLIKSRTSSTARNQFWNDEIGNPKRRT